MAATITITAQDRTKQGFLGVVKNSQQASKALQNVSASSRAASTGMGKTGSSTGALTRALLEGSRGVEDFTSVLGTGGLSGALRASSNNVSQLLLAFGPMAGAIGGVGVALGTILIPRLLDGGDAMDEMSDSADRLISKFDAIEKARLGSLGESAEDIREQARNLRERRDVAAEVTKEIEQQRDSLKESLESGRLTDTQEDEAAEKIERLNERIRERNKEFHEMGEEIRELDILATERSARSARKRREDVDKEIASIKERRAELEKGEPETIGELEKALEDTRAKREEAVKAAKESRELGKLEEAKRQVQIAKKAQEEEFKLEEQLETRRKAKSDKRVRESQSVADELQKVDERRADESRKQQLRQISDIDQIEAKLEEVRKKRAQVRKEAESLRGEGLFDAAKDAIEDLKDLRRDELQLTRQLTDAQDELAAAKEREAEKTKEANQAAVDSLTDRLLKERRLTEGGEKESAIDRLARGLDRGAVFREIATQRVSGQGLTGQEREQAIQKETRKVRGQFQTTGLQSGEIASAQVALIKAGAQQAQKQGKIGDVTLRGLKAAADREAELAAQQEQQAEAIEAIAKGIEQGTRGDRRRRQRAGSGR